MKKIVIGISLLFGQNLFAATCPNLSGTYIGDLTQDVYKIQQDDCSKIQMAYGEDISSLPQSLTVFVADKAIHATEDGHFQTSYFENDTFVIQVFEDSAGKEEAGPKQEFSLYTTSTGTWLQVVNKLEKNSSPQIMLYKKQ